MTTAKLTYETNYSYSEGDLYNAIVYANNTPICKFKTNNKHDIESIHLMWTEVHGDDEIAVYTLNDPRFKNEGPSDIKQMLKQMLENGEIKEL